MERDGKEGIYGQVDFVLQSFDLCKSLTNKLSPGSHLGTFLVFV